jgi:phosphoglycolate phosphatase-like HAD superfamily hydrolase
MNLIIFDIDGTLTLTNHIDGICFQRTLLETFNINLIDCNWAGFPHATDSCIFQEVFLQHLGKLPTLHEIDLFQEKFVATLKESFQLNPMHFSEVAGAGKFLQMLKLDSDWKVAIATGGWKTSAIFKLQCIDVNIQNFPSAFADDAISREEILVMSIQRACNHAMDQAVYVGDGIWDAKACKNLDIPFIGISTKLSPQQLYQEGAVAVFSNFLEENLFLQTINQLPKK